MCADELVELVRVLVPGVVAWLPGPARQFLEERELEVAELRAALVLDPRPKARRNARGIVATTNNLLVAGEPASFPSKPIAQVWRGGGEVQPHRDVLVGRDDSGALVGDGGEGGECGVHVLHMRGPERVQEVQALLRATSYARRVLDPAVPDATYRPTIDPRRWAPIEAFVTEIVDEAAPALPYSRASLLTAVAHHVAWVRAQSGPLSGTQAVFSREMIGASVADMAPATPSTKGRRRSILLRVGEALGAVDRASELPPLSASSSTTPYTRQERAGLRTWVELQGKSAMKTSLRALLALGFGAGLLTRELSDVTAADVGQGGNLVRINGPRARLVPVAAEWQEELASLASTAVASVDTLFRPGVPYSKNTVVDIVRRADGATVVTTQRMRASWIVDRLVEGMPMHELIASAGVRSLDAFVRYEKYLVPPVSPVFVSARV